MTTHTTTHTGFSTDTTLIELRITKVKPEFIWHLLAQAENLKKLYERSNVKVLAMWKTDAGCTHEMYTLLQHKSFAERAQYRDMRMTDPEWVQFDCKIAKFYTEIEDYVCKTSVNFPTLKTINTTGKYMIEHIRPKGFVPFDSKKLCETIVELEKETREMTTVGVLIPVLSKLQTFIVIREFPTDNRMDEVLNKCRDMVLDSRNWATLHDVAQHVVRERNVLVRSIPFDKVKENAAME